MPLISSELLDIYTIVDGLNTIKSGIRLGPTELKNCQNARYTPIGGFKWRLGYDTLGDAPGQACNGLYMARFSSNTNIAFRCRNGMVETMTGLNGTWTDRTNGITLSASQDAPVIFDILNDIVIGVDGVNTPFQCTSGLTVTATGGLPGALIPSAVYQHRGYMFYVTADKLFFSDLNTPATVQTNNFIQVASKAGGNLVGGVDFLGKNYVFKRHGIYAIEFQPTRVNSSGTLFPFIENPDPIVPGVGTQSHRSIVKFTTPATHKTPGQELVFFVDQFGIPRLFDGQTSIAIGTAISMSRDDSITSLANMDRTRLPYTWCVNDTANNLIHCFMSSSGTTQHDTCWVLDYTTGFSWARDSYADAFNCGAIFETTSGVFKPYFAGYNGQVYEMNVGQTDNGAAIVSRVRSGDMYVKSPIVLSKWLYNEVRGATGDDTQAVTINYYKDGEDSASASDELILFKQNQANWDEGSWDDMSWAYSGLTTQSSEINIEAKTLSVEYYNETSGNTATIEGYTLMAQPEGWKQED